MRILVGGRPPYLPGFLNTLAGLFPDRQVVGIHAVDLVLGLGTLHCLSQQQPGPAGQIGASRDTMVD